MKHKARAFARTLYSSKLRCIGNYRKIDILFRNLSCRRDVFIIPFKLSVDKALNDLVLRDLIPVAVHVIPHNELREREKAEYA